ncbi:MAG: hypothetical protein K0M64_10865 [Rhizobium sp.]|nr:hypothetical protein [Rhizobium sp.]
MTFELDPRVFGQRWFWRVIATLISVVALVWVVVLLWGFWPRVAHRLLDGNAPLLLLGLACALISALAAYAAFVVAVRRIVSIDVPLALMFNFYFVSQLLKHLPGRVWGVGYQVVLGKWEGSASRWIAVNLLHIGSAAFAALWSAALLLVRPHWVSFVLAAAGTAIFLAVLPMGRFLEARFSGVRGWKGKLAEWIPFSSVRRKDWLLVFSAFFLANLLHYASWVSYLSAVGFQDTGAALSLSAMYMVAWFVGYASFLTPSGLGVREIVFVALAGSHEPEAVAVMAVVARASYLAVDLLLGLPCLWLPARRTSPAA